MSEAGRREVDHTADLGFDLWAPSLEGLYIEGTLALADLCYDREAVDPQQRRRLAIEGRSAEERLVRWLQEIYLLLESELWLTASVCELTVAGDTVEGVLGGEEFDRDRHTLHTEIKAITYHDLDVRCDDGVWSTTVIVDV